MLSLRDAADKPMVGQSLRYLVVQKGMKIPKEEKDWLAAATAAKTDLDGVVQIPVETPRTIPIKGSHMQVIAKAQVEGLSLSAEATLPLTAPVPDVSLVPEFGVLLPGIPQRLLVHVTFDGKPIVAEVALSGHDLAGSLKTNERGLGMLPWKVPAGIGARVPEASNTGCAGDVAATVTARLVSLPTGIPAVPPIKTCLRVDRDAVAIVRPDRPLVRAGESLSARILGQAMAGLP